MSTPLTYFSTSTNKEPNCAPLSVNGTDFSSLQTLLSKTRPEELYPLLHDHSLLHWLIGQKEEHKAYALAQLLRTVNFTTEFRHILGFPEEHTHELREEEVKAYEKRKNYIRRFTNDESILSCPYSVALNQTELNEILFLGTKKVYLCEDAFKIPLEITDIHYVGLGGAVIRKPLSKEEYAKYNITIDAIPLPEYFANPVTSDYHSAPDTSNDFDDV